MRRTPRTSIIRSVAVGVAVATFAGLATTTPAHAAGIDKACPAGHVTPSGFRDVGRTDTHKTAIDCLVWWGITGGTTPGWYDPASPISRAQLATMLYRLLKHTGDLPPSVPPAPFPDLDRRSNHTTAIDTLAHLGVVNGKNGQFLPAAGVTRDQMATMLIRLLGKEGYKIQFPAGKPFRDTVGNTHEPAILQLVGASITGGTGDGMYNPSGVVNRAQMASFVMRSADHLVARSLAVTPPRGLSSDYGYLLNWKHKPTRWNPCAVIPYKVNLTRSKKSTSLADTQEAVRRISVATGIKFRYDGTSTQIPDETYGSNGTSWAPLLIAWADDAESTLLEANPDAVGLGGATSTHLPAAKYDTAVSGLILIRASADAQLASGFGGLSSGQLLMHELGHVIGLGHDVTGERVVPREQIMHPFLTSNQAVWGAGDLTGLRVLGNAGACAAQVSPGPPTGELIPPRFQIDYAPAHSDH